jgi:hypothetical protein
MGEEKNTCRILARRPERKIPLGRPRRRYVENIAMELRIGTAGGLLSIRQ